MKKLLFLLAFLLPFTMYSQVSYVSMAVETQNGKEISLNLGMLKKNGHSETYINPGVPMLLGGLAFFGLGLATPVETHFVNGKQVAKPFYQQGARGMAMGTGVLLFIPGIVITIGN